MKFVNALFKEDPLQKQLRKINLTTDTLTSDVIVKAIELFQQKTKDN